MANSVDPDQTAPIGSMLFASILNLSVMLGNYLQHNKQTTISGQKNIGRIRFKMKTYHKSSIKLSNLQEETRGPEGPEALT